MSVTKFDWNDILIVPTELSEIDSRSEVDIFKGGKLPLYVSPMDTVVNKENAKLYLDMGFEVCLPRDISWSDDLNLDECFFSYGLDQIIEIISNKEILPDKVLIDIASGHLQKLYKTVSNFKKLYPEKILMVGNVANPKTYKILSLAGADIIRCGIGNGGGCLTTKQLGIGYPMASLVKECYDIKMKMAKGAKIVADGGFKDYSDIIKSLGLGSDGVMLGSVLNKAIESSGDNYFHKIKVSSKLANFLFKRGFKITKKFRGMSTKEVQKKWGRSTLKTSEGVVRYRPVEYTLNGWVENLSDYLKSNMSYCNAKNLDDFIGKVEYNFISNHSYNRFNK